MSKTLDVLYWFLSRIEDIFDLDSDHSAVILILRRKYYQQGDYTKEFNMLRKSDKMKFQFGILSLATT